MSVPNSNCLDWGGLGGYSTGGGLVITGLASGAQREATVADYIHVYRNLSGSLSLTCGAFWGGETAGNGIPFLVGEVVSIIGGLRGGYFYVADIIVVDGVTRVVISCTFPSTCTSSSSSHSSSSSSSTTVEECGYGILICNSNSFTDDNFDILLDANLIGQHVRNPAWDPNGTAPIHGLFITTDPRISLAALTCETCSVCSADESLAGSAPELCELCATSEAITTSAALSLADFAVGAHTLTMNNTQNNGFSNYGRVWVIRFVFTGNTAAATELLVSDTYLGDGDASFSFNFNIDNVCAAPSSSSSQPCQNDTFCIPASEYDPNIHEIVATHADISACTTNCGCVWHCLEPKPRVFTNPLMLAFIDEAIPAYSTVTGDFGTSWEIDVERWETYMASFEPDTYLVFDIFQPLGDLVYPKYALADGCLPACPIPESNIIPTFRPVEADEFTQDAFFNFIVQTIEDKYGRAVWDSLAASDQPVIAIVDDSGSMARSLIGYALDAFASFLALRGVTYIEHIDCPDERWLNWAINLYAMPLLEEPCPCDDECIRYKPGNSTEDPRPESHRILDINYTDPDGICHLIPGTPGETWEVPVVGSPYPGVVVKGTSGGIYTGNLEEIANVLPPGPDADPDPLSYIHLAPNWRAAIQALETEGCWWFIWQDFANTGGGESGCVDCAADNYCIDKFVAHFRYRVFQINCPAQELNDVTARVFTKNYSGTYGGVNGATKQPPDCNDFGLYCQEICAVPPLPDTVPALDCDLVTQCYPPVLPCPLPTIAPNQPAVRLFNKTSWETSLPSMFKYYLDQAADRWMTYVKFNQTVAAAIAALESNWNGIALNAYTEFNDPTSGVIAACGPYNYVDLQTGGPGVQFNTVNFNLWINMAYADAYTECEWIDILTHELGHALGIGVYWSAELASDGAVPPTDYFLDGTAYTHTQEAYNELTALARPITPVEDEGGAGTTAAHWEPEYRPATTAGAGGQEFYGLFDELMVGVFERGVNFKLSKISINALRDFGYQEVTPNANEGDVTITTNFMRMRAAEPVRHHCPLPCQPHKLGTVILDANAPTESSSSTNEEPQS